MVFHVCLLLHSIMVLRVLYIVACISSLFFFTVEYYSIVWIYHNVFIHMSVDGQLKYFQFGVMLSNAVMSICMWVLGWTYVFIALGYIPRSRIAESNGNSMVSSWRNFQTVSVPKCLYHLTFPPAIEEGSISLHLCQHLLLSIFYYYSFSSGLEVFHLHFPYD